MNYYTIGALVLLAIGLFRNYRKDPGEYTKAKGIHAICLALLCIRYAQSIGTIISLYNNLDPLERIAGRQVGLIPGQIHLILYLAEIILSLMTLFVLFKMVFRDPAGLKWFLRLLPWLFLINAFDFYQMWILVAGITDTTFRIYFFIGLAFTAAIIVALFFIYRSRFMKEFFGLEAKAEAMQEADVLDTDI